MSTRLPVKLIILSLTLAVMLGCSQTGPAAKPTAVPGEITSPTNPSAALTPGSTQLEGTPMQLEIPDETPIDEGISLTADTLDTLKSYAIQMTIKLQGKNADDKSLKQTIQILDEVDKNKPARHYKIDDDNPDAEMSLGKMDAFSLGENVYLYDPRNTESVCTISTTSDMPLEDMGLFSASDYFDTIEKGDLLKQGEEVNGVKTDHYTVKNAYLITGNPTSVKGEVWLAQEGGYVVRFTGEAEGDFEIQGDSATGTVTWEYNVSKINQSIDVKLNSECEAAAKAIDEFPFPANATDPVRSSDLLSFNSPDEPGVVAGFLRAQLPGKGWKIISEDDSQAPLIIMTIENGSFKMDVTITPGDAGGSSVIISPSITTL